MREISEAHCLSSFRILPICMAFKTMEGHVMFSAETLLKGKPILYKISTLHNEHCRNNTYILNSICECLTEFEMLKCKKKNNSLYVCVRMKFLTFGAYIVSARAINLSHQILKLLVATELLRYDYKY